jgi:transcriptional regulator with XRE-family HTH domain
MAKLILKEVLIKKNVSKRQFSKRLGIPYKYVFRYFREGYDPKLSTLAAWAKALEVKISALYRE